MFEGTLEDAQYDSDLRQAVVDTEREIFFSATGSDGDEDEAEGNDQIVEEGSDVEGWNGENLPIDEIAATSINGFSPINNDRPLQTLEESELRAQNEDLRQQLGLVSNLNDEFILQPQRQQQLAQVRENVKQQMLDQYDLGHLGYDDAKLDRFINDVAAAQAQTATLQENRANASFGHAHNVHGAAFEQAYGALTSLPVTATTINLVRDDLMRSSDPGARLMQMWDSGVLDGLGAGSRPMHPILGQIRNARTQAARARRAPTENERSWSEEADEEADIMSSVWD
jgi:hypothetical protein